MMKLWILRPKEPYQGPWNPWYDKAFGFVIRAESEKEARQIASENSGNEGSHAWQDGELSSCQELTPDGKAELIIKDFALA